MIVAGSDENIYLSIFSWPSNGALETMADENNLVAIIDAAVALFSQRGTRLE
jgi:hypothetical protein